MRFSRFDFRVMLALIFTATFTLPAQKLSIRNFNVQHGLAQSQVKTIIQDRIKIVKL